MVEVLSGRIEPRIEAGIMSVISEFEARRVQRMLASLYLGKLETTEGFTVSGWREGDWVCIRWELADTKRAFVYPVDCRVDAKRHKLRESDAKDVIIDFLGHFMGLFLDDRSEPFTGPKWESVQFAGRELWVRGQVRNESAEADANAMLSDDARERSRHSD